jgi:hypothetical protein
MMKGRQQNIMKWMKWIGFILVLIFAVGVFIGYVVEPEYAYLPPEDKTIEMMSNDLVTTYRKNAAYDLFGETITQEEAKSRSVQDLSSDNGAIKITDDLLKLGKEAFYKETFGNEVFLTDIMGIIDGAFSIPNITKAIISLNGKGTTNLFRYV